MSEDVRTKMTALIEEAKGHKATREMANLDYKHSMKKLSMLAEAHPALAKELGIVDEEKKGDEKKGDEKKGGEKK